MYTTRILALSLILSGSLCCGAAFADSKKDSQPVVITLNDDNFAQTIAGAKLPVLVDFYASWCGPCQKMAPEIEALSRELKGKLIVAKVDIDRCPKLRRQFAITSVPTLILFEAGGKQLRRETGGKTLAQLHAFVKPALKD